MAAIADMEKFQTPAPMPRIEAWIAELVALTAGRGPDGIDAEVFLSAFSSRLSQYPADVARNALLGRSWKWFPSWAELEDECKRLAAPRRCILAALKSPAQESKRVWRKPTHEERKRMADLIAKTFPQASQAHRDAAIDAIGRGGLMTEGGE